MIYQNNKSKVWYMDFVVNGSRVHKSCRTVNKKEAQTIHDDARQELKRAQAEEKQKALVPEWMKPTMISLSEARDRMYEEQWHSLKDSKTPVFHINYIISVLGDVKDLREAGSPMNVKLLTDSLNAKGVCYKTINRYLTSFRSLLRRGLNVWNALDKEPRIKEFMRDETRTGRLRVYSDEERQFIKDFFTKNSHDANGLKVRDFVEVLFYTGMRRGELLGTTLRDLTLYPQEDARIMSYENKESAVKAIPLVPPAARLMESLALKAISDTLAYLLQVEPSSVEAQAQQILEELCTDPIILAQANQKKALKSSPDCLGDIRGKIGGYDFKSLSVTGLSKGQVEYHWKKLKKETFLGKDDQAVMHAIRHTFASKLIGTGASLYEVQALLGHKSSKTTETYAHLKVSQLRATSLRAT